MKKPSILLLFALFIFAGARSQQLTSGRTILEDSTQSASRSTIDLPFFNSATDANKIIAGIMDAVGLDDTNFKLKEAHVPNVEASIRHHERYILYNPDFVDQVNRVTNDKWPSIFILAHEIGHHLSGHTVLGLKSCPAIELEADQFAGFVLHRMGASLDEAQLAMHYIANVEASKTHPARADRLVAIEKGWDKARAEQR
jgi:hypothetical protein